MDEKFLRNAEEKGVTASHASDPPRLFFPRACRLTRRVEYDAVYRDGKRRSNREFTVFLRPNGLGVSRFGWSIKKALGTAVRRNRIRRRLREIVRLHQQEIARGMGHRDSSTQLGGHGGICATGHGAVAADTAGFAARRTAEAGIGAGKSAGQWLALGFLRFYQVFLGPFLGGACKFYPSCSNYAYEAVNRHGVRRGTGLALKRLGRCRPFTKGGFDPVPEPDETSSLPEPAVIRKKAEDKESRR